MPKMAENDADGRGDLYDTATATARMFVARRRERLGLSTFIVGGQGTASPSGGGGWCGEAVQACNVAHQTNSWRRTTFRRRPSWRGLPLRLVSEMGHRRAL